MIRIAAVGLVLALTQTAAFSPPAFSEVEFAALVLGAEDTKRIDALLPLIGDSDPAVRARVVLALARIGVPAGLEPAIELLSDSDLEVKRQAVFAIGKLEFDLAGRGEAALRDRAREALLDHGTNDREIAPETAWALGQIGGAREALVAILGANDPDLDPRLSRFVLDAWWRTDGATPEPLAAYVAAATPAVRLAAANALRRLEDPAALPLLARLLDDSDPEVRAMAIRGMTGAPRRLVDEKAPALLADADRRVQCAAAGWIRESWAALPDEPPIDATLVSALRRTLDRSAMVRGCALAALGAVVDSRAVAADRLLEALTDAEPAVRGIALDALASTKGDLAELAWARFAGDSTPESVVGGPIGWGSVLRLAVAAEVESTSTLEQRVRSDDGSESSAALALLVRAAPDRAELIVRDLYGGGEGSRPEAGLRGLLALFRTGAWAPDMDLQEQVWRSYWDSRTSPGTRGLRSAALDLLLATVPATLELRTSLLTSEPDRLLRLRWMRAMDPALGGLARDEALLAHAGSLEDPQALAARVLELQAQPPRIELETPRGIIVIELRADWAPRTVVRFVDLIEDGALLGNRFHRVIPGFVAQGGGLDVALSSLPGEDSLVDYRAGRVGLALAGRDTGTSQFFLTRAEQPHLVGLYPVFGEVVEGQRVVDRLLPGDPVDIRRSQ